MVRSLPLVSEQRAAAYDTLVTRYRGLVRFCVQIKNKNKFL